MVDDGAGKTINQELLLSYEPDFVICSADLEEQVKTAEFLRKQGSAKRRYSMWRSFRNIWIC